MKIVDHEWQKPSQGSEHNTTQGFSGRHGQPRLSDFMQILRQFGCGRDCPQFMLFINRHCVYFVKPLFDIRIDLRRGLSVDEACSVRPEFDRNPVEI
jgi:hypothetical protein